MNRRDYSQPAEKKMPQIQLESKSFHINSGIHWCTFNPVVNGKTELTEGE